MRRGLFNESSNFFRSRDAHNVAGARDFDDAALRARRVPAFEVRTDGPVGACDQHPAWFTAPSGGGDCGGEVVRKIQDLRTRHESGHGQEEGRQQTIRGTALGQHK